MLNEKFVSDIKIFLDSKIEFVKVETNKVNNLLLKKVKNYEELESILKEYDNNIRVNNSVLENMRDQLFLLNCSILEIKKRIRLVRNNYLYNLNKLLNMDNEIESLRLINSKNQLNENNFIVLKDPKEIKEFEKWRNKN
jgi:hypothetical protein